MEKQWWECPTHFDITIVPEILMFQEISDQLFFYLALSYSKFNNLFFFKKMKNNNILLSILFYFILKFWFILKSVLNIKQRQFD